MTQWLLPKRGVDTDAGSVKLFCLPQVVSARFLRLQARMDELWISSSLSSPSPVLKLLRKTCCSGACDLTWLTVLQAGMGAWVFQAWSAQLAPDVQVGTAAGHSIHCGYKFSCHSRYCPLQAAAPEIDACVFSKWHVVLSPGHQRFAVYSRV